MDVSTLNNDAFKKAAFSLFLTPLQHHRDAHHLVHPNLLQCPALPPRVSAPQVPPFPPLDVNPQPDRPVHRPSRHDVADAQAADLDIDIFQVVRLKQGEIVRGSSRVFDPRRRVAKNHMEVYVGRVRNGDGELAADTLRIYVTCAVSSNCQKHDSLFFFKLSSSRCSSSSIGSSPRRRRSTHRFFFCYTGWGGRRTTTTLRG